MGSPVSPVLANLYKESFEEQSTIISSEPTQMVEKILWMIHLSY